jgi:hypothetical protein
MFMSLTNA